MNAFQLNYTNLNISQTTATSYSQFSTYLNSVEDYSIDDYSKTPSENPSRVTSSQNPVVTCANDEWRLNSDNCVRTPASTSLDPEPFRNSPSLPYCLVIPNLSYNTAANRYDSVGLAGCAAGAIPHFARVKTCVESHDTKIAEMKTDFNTDIDPEM